MLSKTSALRRRVFYETDAGEPLSLRFLCEAFELDLRAVQAMARTRIAAGNKRGTAEQWIKEGKR